VSAEVRSAVSLFTSIQQGRTRDQVARAEFLNSFVQFSSCRPVTREDMRAFLTERYLRFEPSDREVEGAWTVACVALNNGEPPGKNEGTLLGVAVQEIAPRLAVRSTLAETVADLASRDR
jgi:hypothetical protein